jgi:hypothetical protein
LVSVVWCNLIGVALEIDTVLEVETALGVELLATLRS